MLAEPAGRSPVYGVRDDDFVGRLTGYKFYEAVMSSHARLTYTKVWHMLQGDQNCANTTRRW